MFNGSPSELAVIASGKKPLKGSINGEFKCNLCGHEFDAGGFPYKATQQFNNQADTHGTSAICKYCNTVIAGQHFILTYKCAVYTQSGIFSLNKDVDIAAFVYHRPKPPILAVWGAKKQQHVVWRTPISKSSKLISFRYDDAVFAVDMVEVEELATLYRPLLAEVNDYRKKLDPKVRDLPSYFSVPTSAIRKKEDVSALAFNHQIMKVLSDTQNGKKALYDKLVLFTRRLNSLNFAEVFLVIAASKHTKAETKIHATQRLIKNRTQ